MHAEVDALRLAWSLVHTDPSPEVVTCDDRSGVTGPIDWTGAGSGPVLYDVASSVMYLGGPETAVMFLAAHREHGILPEDEWRHLDALRRFRWAVQGADLTRHLAHGGLTGIGSQADNGQGLADARDGPARLGFVTS